MKFLSKILFFVGALVLVQACTVGYSFSGADIPAQARTFSVKTFQRATAQAPSGYANTLTEELKDLLISQTSLSLAEQRGDLQYEGVITNYEVQTSGVTSAEQVSVSRLTISVKVKYVNTFEKEKNIDKTFTRYADFGANESLSTVEARLISDINAQLTQDIFDATLGAW